MSLSGFGAKKRLFLLTSSVTALFGDVMRKSPYIVPSNDMVNLYRLVLDVKLGCLECAFKVP